MTEVDAGKLSFRFEKDRGVFVRESRDYLRRALQIGRSIGWEKSEVITCRKLAVSLRERALEKGGLVPAHWFSELDLDFRLSDFRSVGDQLEILLLRTYNEEDWHNRVELWRLAARAFHFAKVEESKSRCLVSAAELLVEQAHRKSESAMLASHFLSDAIAQLHGVPEAKERRTKLRHELIDLQARIHEEMSTLSQEMDLRDIVEQVENSLKGTTLLQKFFIFAGMATSPDPDKLRNDAKENILRYPLSTLFGMSHLDREGKTIKRGMASGLSGDPNDDEIWIQVAQGETIRRALVCSGQIEPAMHLISAHHYVSEEAIETLLRSSPFVPNDKRLTFARGFARFFQGDYISAIYIITPLLESGLRHILRLNGFDVSIFDDATMTQEDRTISSMFDQMRPQLEGIVTKAIAADIERVFLKKPGPYVRHAVAHGLLYDGDPFGVDCRYACWLVFRLCLLPLFSHRKDLETAFAETVLGQKSE